MFHKEGNSSRYRTDRVRQVFVSDIKSHIRSIPHKRALIGYLVMILVRVAMLEISTEWDVRVGAEK